MKTLIYVMSEEGDIEIRWDDTRPEEQAEARRAVMDLKRQGFSFFLVDGSPAPDEVSAGKGLLNCRRVDAESLLPDAVEGADAAKAETPTDTPLTPSSPRRGRKRTEAGTPDRQVVATRPLRGG